MLKGKLNPVLPTSRTNICKMSSTYRQLLSRRKSPMALRVICRISKGEIVHSVYISIPWKQSILKQCTMYFTFDKT